jgi:hypothetical protein
MCNGWLLVVSSGRFTLEVLKGQILLKEVKEFQFLEGGKVNRK